MGTSQGGLEFTIRARNESDPAFRSYDENVRRARTGHDTLAAGARETTQTFKAMTTGLLTELNPALAGAVDRMSAATREARQLSPALGGITIGAAAAAIALGTVVQALNEGVKFTVDLNRAVKAVDLGTLRGQATAVADGLATMAERSKSVLGGLQNFVTQGATGLGVLLGVTETYEQRLLRLRDAYEKVFPKQAAVEIQQALIQRLEAEHRLLEVQRQRAAEKGDEGRVRELNAGIAQSIDLIAVAQKGLTDKTIDLREAAELAVAPFSVIRDQLEKVRVAMKGVTDEQTKATKTAEQIGSEKILREMGVERLSTLRQLVIQGAAFTETQTEAATGSKMVLSYTQAALPAIDAAIVAELRKKNVLASQLVDLTQQIEAHQRLTERISLISATALAGYERQKIGATALQQTLIDLTEIEERRAAALLSIRENDPNAELRRRQVEATAALDRARVQFEYERKYDFGTGVGQGFKEVVDDMRRFGDAGADAVKNFARTAEQTMSDLFFLPVQDGWKKTFEELPQKFAMSALRIVTDTFARMTIGSILQGLGGGGPGGFSLGGLATGAGAVSSVIPGLGVGGGGVGALAAVNVAGASASQLADLQSRGYTIVQGANGESIALPVLPISSFNSSPGLVGEFLNSPIVPGRLRTDTLTMTDELTGETMTFQSAPYLSSGMTFGQAIGIGAGATAAAISLYGAYRSGSPLGGAVAGAFSGAYLSTALANAGLYSGDIYTTIAGAIIGAAAGAGAGFLGEEGPTHAQREQAEAARASGAAQGLVNAIQAAKSIEDVYRTLAFYQSGYVGGRSATAIPTTIVVNGVTKNVGPFAGGATLSELIDHLDTLTASVQQGVNPSLLASSNQAVQQAVQSTVATLLQRDAAARFSFNDVFGPNGVSAGAPDVFGPPGTITRTTILPFTQLESVRGQGKQLAAIEQSMLDLPDDAVAALLQRMADVDVSRNMKILTVDNAAREIVRSRSWIPSVSSVSRDSAGASADLFPGSETFASAGGAGDSGGASGGGTGTGTGSASGTDSDSAGVFTGGITIGGFNFGGNLPAGMQSQGVVADAQNSFLSGLGITNPAAQGVVGAVTSIALSSIPVVGQVLGLTLAAINAITGTVTNAQTAAALNASNTGDLNTMTSNTLASLGFPAEGFAPTVVGPSVAPDASLGNSPSNSVTTGEGIAANGMTVSDAQLAAQAEFGATSVPGQISESQAQAMVFGAGGFSTTEGGGHFSGLSAAAGTFGGFGSPSNAVGIPGLAGAPTYSGTIGAGVGDPAGTGNVSGGVAPGQTTSTEGSSPSNSGVGTAACFTGDTGVLMADGTWKPIRDVTIGDRLLSWDWRTKASVAQRVTRMRVGHEPGYYELNGLQVTGQHRFAVGPRAWTRAHALRAGDVVLGLGEPVVIDTARWVAAPGTRVYNLSLEPWHNFYVRDPQGVAYLVHNGGGGGGGSK